MPWNRRHLLTIEELSLEELDQIYATAVAFKRTLKRSVRKVPALRGKTIVNLFLEPSTRTRMAFDMAAKRLSADVISVDGASSSATKGETLRDTAQNIEALQADMLVIRHAAAGSPLYLSRILGIPVINAGDGQHEHPTQALLDAATIRRHKGAISGLEIAIVGDIAHSRVARSNILCLSKLGARVRLVGPWTLIPRGIELIGGELTRERVRLCPRLEDGIEGADVVMMLRVQHERFEGEAPRFPNTRELSRTFGLSERTLAYAKSDAIVMHPGPINRGVEVSPQVADGPRAVILQQVSWGIAIRMAVLERAILGDVAPAAGAA